MRRVRRAAGNPTRPLSHSLTFPNIFSDDTRHSQLARPAR